MKAVPSLRNCCFACDDDLCSDWATMRRCIPYRSSRQVVQTVARCNTSEIALCVDRKLWCSKRSCGLLMRVSIKTYHVNSTKYSNVIWSYWNFNAQMKCDGIFYARMPPNESAHCFGWKCAQTSTLLSTRNWLATGNTLSKAELKLFSVQRPHHPLLVASLKQRKVRSREKWVWRLEEQFLIKQTGNRIGSQRKQTSTKWWNLQVSQSHFQKLDKAVGRRFWKFQENVPWCWGLDLFKLRTPSSHKRSLGRTSVVRAQCPKKL